MAIVIFATPVQRHSVLTAGGIYDIDQGLQLPNAPLDLTTQIIAVKKGHHKEHRNANREPLPGNDGQMALSLREGEITTSEIVRTPVHWQCLLTSISSACEATSAYCSEENGVPLKLKPFFLLTAQGTT